MPLYQNTLYNRTLGSAPTQRGAGTYGAIPQVPDPSATQKTAIGGNVSNLGDLYGLTGSLNTEIAKQAALPFQLNLPNYQKMLGQSSGNILQELQGQVPTDVANQLSQMAAERGISTGSIGSPNANAALMRSLGLTSVGLQQQGEQNLTGAIGRTPTGQQFNPQSFLTTPAQQQELQYLSNLLAAAPTPGAGDRANLRYLQQGLGGMGGIGGPPSMGGGGAPGADFFGQVYNPGGEPGMIVGQSRSSPYGLGSASTPMGGTGDAYANWNQWWNRGSQGPMSYGGFGPGDFEAMGNFDDQSPWGADLGNPFEYGTEAGLGAGGYM